MRTEMEARKLSPLILAFAGLILLGLFTPATSAEAASKARIPKCSISSYGFEPVRTSHWNPGCTGGSYDFRKFRWAGWGNVAVGTGRVALRVCRPDCVHGYLVTFRARLRAKRVRWCHGTRMYTRVISRVRYSRGNPLGMPAGWQRRSFPMHCN